MSIGGRNPPVMLAAFFMSPAPSSVPMESFEFGRYEILEEVGRGGMGVVYRARQIDLDRPVAIKMILANHLASPEQVSRLHREAQAAARVNHANVVGIFETGVHNGQHYIAMEFVEGKSFGELLDNRSIDLHESGRIVADVARAVQSLHEQGILHRDLKPSNILVADDGRPRVTDFGLARTFQEEGNDSVVSGMIVGTPGYLAPELVAGSTQMASPQTDVYGLGAILYEAATGETPFADSSPIQTLLRTLEQEPQPPRSIDPRIPVELETVILKCLERQPERRYPTAAALASDLQRWLTGEPIEALPPAGWHRLRRWARRHPELSARLLAFAAFYLLLVFGRFVTNEIQRSFAALTVWLVIWSAASALCDFLQVRRKDRRRIRFAWATIDAVLLTLIMMQGDPVSSPRLLVYPLMLVASGFWFRVSLVVYVTVLALLSYAALLVHSAFRFPDADVPLDRHLVFLTVMLITGLVVGMQVRRARAISQYCTKRLL